MLGKAMPIAGPGREEFLDGDIILLTSELQELLAPRGIKTSIMDEGTLKQPLVKSVIEGTSLHEIGHFLGLHHQFKPEIESIMSYSENARLSFTIMM